MSTSTINGYTDVVTNLPDEAFLGSLLWFSISRADVNLDDARTALAAAGLSTTTLRKNLRPVDAFKKASKEVAHKFNVKDDVRSEFLVRPVGEDGEQSHRHIILERAEMKAGKKRRLVYEKVGEIVFNRGTKKKGLYENYSVETRQATHITLTPDEQAWLDGTLDQAKFEGRFEHLLTHMDSHAVRTFVREYVYELSGTCVKETGGLYFVAQEHAEEIKKLWAWVESIGSEFHVLPILDLKEQRQMLIDAFENETVQEVERLIGEVTKILSDPARTVEAKTFDAYGEKAAILTKKIDEYNKMLGARADRAAIEVQGYVQQVMTLAGRIREPKATTKVTA